MDVQDPARRSDDALRQVPSLVDQRAMPTPLPPPPPLPATPSNPPTRRPTRARRLIRLAASGLVAAALIACLVVVVHKFSPEPDSSTSSQPGKIDDGTPNPIDPVGQPTSINGLVVDVRPSIVAIHTTLTQTDVLGRDIEGSAAGSGFVLSADGLIVTNNHVIEGADDIQVTLDDGTVEAAEVIGADARSDLAVLQIARTDLRPVTLGESAALKVGDSVVAIGNALDLGAEPTVTGGLVSAKGRRTQAPNGSFLVDLIQTDAAISPGNSGGPLLDMNGRVVGINTAVAGQGQNIGFAISIDRAKLLLEQLRNGVVPEHPLLGVTTQPSQRLGSGAEVVSVQDDSGADLAGIRVGDVIVELDDEQIDSPEDLSASIAERQPGELVTITLDRDGESQSIEVTLGVRDASDS